MNLSSVCLKISCVCVCVRVNGWSKSVFNDGKCKRTEGEREVRGRGETEGKRRALQRCEGKKCKQDKERESETMMGTEERRQEEVSLIYTLKKPQILHGSTQLSIEGEEAIYSIFYFLILSSLWCAGPRRSGSPLDSCVSPDVQPFWIWKGKKANAQGI